MRISSDQRRTLAIAMPLLPTDRLRRRGAFAALPADEPLVVVEKVGGALRLAHVDRASHALGLATGITLADARARVPKVTVAEAQPESDAALLARIADWCDRYTPLVALDPPHGLLLDVTGCAHLFGGEAALVEDVVARLAHLGIAASAALAGAPDTARALAKVGRGGVLPPGGEAEAVRPLPVAILDLDPVQARTLVRAGLKTIADLADRPRAPLAARFGAGLVARLERLLGEAERPISPRRPIPVALAERIFAEPIGRTEDIEETLLSLARELTRRFEARGEGGRRFEASFFRVDGLVRRIAVATARPSRDAAALARLFRERLDALSDPLDAGFGFDLIRLSALSSEPLSAVQADFDGRDLEEEAVSDLIDRLGARFGPDRVLRFRPDDTHIPEGRARLVPALLAGDAPRWEFTSVPGEPPERPISLFDPPQPIEALAEVPDGPPFHFRWRRVTHTVARAEGPERIAPEWWRRGDDSLVRDYYRVEDEAGHRFWLYREGLFGEAHPRWFLHGVFA